MKDPWILLQLIPEDSLEVKATRCIEFFQGDHPLVEHIAVLEFVACQAQEGRRFSDVWRRCLTTSEAIEINSVIAVLTRSRWD